MDNWKKGIDNWLSALHAYSADRLKQIIEIVVWEVDMVDDDTLQIPYDKFASAGITEEETHKVLLKLDEKGIIHLYKAEVLSFEGPPTYDPETNERIPQKVLSISGGMTLNKDKFEYLYKALSKIISKKDGKLEDFFLFNGMVFYLKLANGESTPIIDFHPKSGETTDPYCLMVALVENLRTQGERQGEWIKTKVSVAKIIKSVQKQLSDKKEINMRWIQTTRGNLIKKIPDQYSELIKIGYFESKSKSYPFDIRVSL